MQVSHVQDHVTHAVIGGRKAINFGISDSPEFFNILSSTLYSDQILAVVREVLCNAWDAHIEAGCIDRAVDITITDEKITFRDYGTGIHDDDIGPIYGVYGASTKKANGNVTGGFGLGCKAPFAYTDHFEVTSSHGGRRTIYNLSKSSAEVMGKPGITPIASFPSEKSGLQVSIPLKNNDDKRRFEKLVRRIAANGEMKVNLNDDELGTIPFSTMTNGFLITKHTMVENQHIHRLLVRYGNVAYPIESHDEYYDNYNKIFRFLGEITHHNSENYNIVFQAPPHSISATPSRESLSMQEHTITTLKGLLADFTKLLDQRFEPDCLELAQSCVNDVWTNMKPASLFSTKHRIPGLAIRNERFGGANLTEIPQAVRLHAAKEYPDFRGFRFNDLMNRVNLLIDQNFGHSGLLKSFRSELLRSERRKQKSSYSSKNVQSNWLQRKVIWPLVRDLDAINLTSKKLFVYSSVESRWGRTSTEFTEATRFKAMSVQEYLPYLRNIAVLSHNRLDVELRMSSFPILKNWLGDNEGFLVYIVPRNSKKAAEARAFLEQRGVNLIDLTVAQPWEHKTIIQPVTYAPSTPALIRGKGLPILSSLKKNAIHMDWLDEDDAVNKVQRTENPEIVVRIPHGRSTTCIDDFGEKQTNAICALWGDKIGVAINAPQVKKFENKGAKLLNPWIAEQVSTQVLNNPLIQQAIAFDWGRLKRGSPLYQYETLFCVIYQDKELRTAFGIKSDMTPTDLNYFQLWQAIRDDYNFKYNEDVKKALEFAKKIKLSTYVTKLYAQMGSSKLLRMIEFIELRYLMHSSSPEKVRYETRKILITAIKKG